MSSTIKKSDRKFFMSSTIKKSDRPLTPAPSATICSIRPILPSPLLLWLPHVPHRLPQNLKQKQRSPYVVHWGASRVLHHWLQPSLHQRYATYQFCALPLSHEAKILQGATTILKRLLDKLYGSQSPLIKWFLIANQTYHRLYPLLAIVKGN